MRRSTMAALCAAAMLLAAAPSRRRPHDPDGGRHRKADLPAGDPGERLGYFRDQGLQVELQREPAFTLI